jgi:hypothetical protein
MTTLPPLPRRDRARVPPQPDPLRSRLLIGELVLPPLLRILPARLSFVVPGRRPASSGCQDGRARAWRGMSARTLPPGRW